MPASSILQRLREGVHGARVADLAERADRMTPDVGTLVLGCGNQRVDGVAVTDLAEAPTRRARARSTDSSFSAFAERGGRA